MSNVDYDINLAQSVSWQDIECLEIKLKNGNKIKMSSLSHKVMQQMAIVIGNQIKNDKRKIKALNKYKINIGEFYNCPKRGMIEIIDTFKDNNINYAIIEREDGHRVKLNWRWICQRCDLLPNPHILKEN